MYGRSFSVLTFVVETVARFTALSKREDRKLLEKRKRLLESFLENCVASFPEDSVLWMFLSSDEDHAWSQEALKVREPVEGLQVITNIEAVHKKSAGAIDERLVEYEAAFVSLEKAILAIEDGERLQLSRLVGTPFNVAHGR